MTDWVTQIVNILGGDKYDPIAQCLAHDPYIMIVRTAVFITVAASLAIMGTTVVIYNNPSITPRPSARIIFGVLGLLLSAHFAVSAVVTFVPVFRLTVAVGAVLAAFCVVTLFMTFDRLASRRGAAEPSGGDS